jgi:hypothetical protein
MVLCNITTPSIIFLPGMKVVCEGLTTVSATLFILLGECPCVATETYSSIDNVCTNVCYIAKRT